MKKIKYCNMCGKELETKQEDWLSIEKKWGYFSQNDQTVIRVQVCEACFWKMTKSFAVPAEIDIQAELL